MIFFFLGHIYPTNLLNFEQGLFYDFCNFKQVDSDMLWLPIAHLKKLMTKVNTLYAPLEN